MRLNTVQLSRMDITDPFWKQYTDLVEDVIIPYQWDIMNDNVPGVESSHCLENFKIAAGLKKGQFYGAVFQDTDVAKWLEAVGYSLAEKKNEKLEKLADDAIDVIVQAQQEDGYLDTYFIIKEPSQRWRNLCEGHELYSAGHMIEPNTPFLHVIPGTLKEVQNITLSGSETNTKQNIGRGWNARPDSVEDTYPMNDSIWSRVHARLDCGHWVPEYEDGVWEFELEDSKRSDLPGDIFQWPRYYSAFVDYFSGMNADLHYLDADAVWTKDLSEDGQTMIVTMTRGDEALTLSYSLQTQEISSGDRLPAIMTLTIFDLSTAPSGEKTCTLSAEDAAVVETLFSIDSMTPTANDSESVCAYQFDIENRSYLLDDSLDYVDVVVRESEGDYTYYCKHLSDAEIESLREIIEVYAK